MPPNTACTRPPGEHRGHDGGTRRVFEQFAWLEAGSSKAALILYFYRILNFIKVQDHQTQVYYDKK